MAEFGRIKVDVNFSKKAQEQIDVIKDAVSTLKELAEARDLFEVEAGFQRDKDEPEYAEAPAEEDTTGGA